MWQVLLCFIAFASAAPDYSLEDFDDYYFPHRFLPQVSQYHVAPVHFMRAFPSIKTYSGAQPTAAHPNPKVKKVGEAPRVDVTHVRNPGPQKPRLVRQPSQPVFYRKVDFDDDDDDRIYFGGAGPIQYRTRGSPGFYKYDDDDDDDDRVFFGGRFQPLARTYSSPGTGQIRYYDDDLFDFDDDK